MRPPRSPLPAPLSVPSEPGPAEVADPHIRCEQVEPALAPTAARMWRLIDEGEDDVALNKLVVGLTAPERRRLMTTPRTQWAETPDAAQMTPLMAAVAGGNLPAARVLVEEGRPGSLMGLREAGAGSLGTRTPLMVAAMYGNVEALDLLVGPAMGDDVVRQLVEARPVPAATVAWLRLRHPEPGFFHGALYQACERECELALASLDLVAEHGGVRLADFPDLMAIALAGRQFDLARALLDRGLSPALDVRLSMQKFALKGRKWTPLKADAAGGHGASTLALTLMYGCQRAYFDLPKILHDNTQTHLEVHLPADIATVELDARAREMRYALVAHILGGKGFNRPCDVDDRLLTGLVLSGDVRAYAALAHSELFWPQTAQVASSLVELAGRPGESGSGAAGEAPRGDGSASDLAALLEAQMRVLHLREREASQQPARPRLGRLLGRRVVRAVPDEVQAELARARRDVLEMIDVVEGGGSQLSEALTQGLRIDPQSQALVAAAARRPSLRARLAVAVGRGEPERGIEGQPRASASRPTRLLLTDH